MIRGTTPTHVFNIPIDTGTLKAVRVTYKQYSRVILEKTEDDAEMEGNTIRFTLTQEETLKFSHNILVRLQLKVLTNTGTLLASPIRELSVDDIFCEEVLK